MQMQRVAMLMLIEVQAYDAVRKEKKARAIARISLAPVYANSFVNAVIKGSA